MFDDPYLNSIAPLLSTKDKNDNYMFPKETRDKIMDLEVKKIEYSQKFTDHINRYNKIKDTSTEQELADLTKNFNEDLKSFNDFKFKHSSLKYLKSSANWNSSSMNCQIVSNLCLPSTTWYIVNPLSSTDLWIKIGGAG